MTERSGYLTVEEKLHKLALKLLEKTREGIVAWQPTDSENVFSYSSTQSSVFIDGKFDSDDDFVGGLDVKNERGASVERLRTEFEDRAESTVSDRSRLSANERYIKGPYNDTLEDLFEVARRSALNIDEILDDLLDELDEQ